MTGPAILILGGTGEARRLAMALESRFDVVTSLAGRTVAPTALPGRVRRGGFGGVEGLVDFLRAEGFAAMIDATHPYAARMGANAAAAAARTGVPLLRLDRPPWIAEQDDRWVEFPSVAALAGGLSGLGRHALVTLGGADLAAFEAAVGVRLTVRAVDPPTGLPTHPEIEVILDRGPFDFEAELALLSARGIDVLATRNAGGVATRAKLDAARRLNLPVAMLARPQRPVTPAVDTVAAAVDWAKDWAVDRAATQLKSK